ncbi:MAG: glycoside hydrolase domain-containing protein, partial [Pirellulales bacterium]
TLLLPLGVGQLECRSARDTRHVNWPPGDMYLIYPGPSSSIRLGRRGARRAQTPGCGPGAF